MDLLLEHELKLGGTDYSDEIQHMIIRKKRATTTKPATAGNATPEPKASTRSAEVEIVFFSGDPTATLAWREIWDAIDSDSAELTFSGKFKDAAISANNPVFSGTAIVTTAETPSGDPNTYPQHRFTFQCTAAGIAEDTTP